jgi:hypothetical protein
VTRPQTDTSPRERLAHARGQIGHVEHAVAAHPPELRELHTVVDGAITSAPPRPN